MEDLICYCFNYTRFDIEWMSCKTADPPMGLGTSHPYRTASFSTFPGLNFTALPAAI
jgi:hypothetical protein